MNKRKVLFRADAKPAIGIGDLMSLIHLSDHFRRREWTPYFLIRDYPAGTALARQKGVENLTVIPGDATLEEEEAAIARLAEAEGIDLLFFEITERKLTDYRLPPVPAACVNFDGHIPPGLRLVVNWDVVAKEKYRPEEHPGTRFLLGPENVILPVAFDREKVAARVLEPEPRSLLIAMGGADEHDFTARIYKGLREAGMALETTIVVGSGYQPLDALETLAAESGGKTRVLRNVEDMFSLYLSHSLAVGAGGLTSSELVATRTPCVLVATYEHQTARCAYFDKMGWAAYAGYRTVDPAAILEAMERAPRLETAPPFDTAAIVRAAEAALEAR